MVKFLFLLPSLIAFSALTFLAFYIYFKNPYNYLNKIFIIFLLCSAFWAFAEAAIDTRDSPEWALFWTKVAALGWIFLGPTYIHFILILTRRMKMLLRLPVLFLIYVPALVFLYFTWRTDFILTYDFTKRGMLWDVPVGRFFWLFAIWAFGMFIVSFSLLITFIRKTKVKSEKTRVRFVLVSIVVPIIIIFSISVIPPLLGIYTVTQIVLEQIVVPLVALFLGGFITYAIMKYKLFIISSTIAIPSIVSTMCEALIVTNPDGFVEMVNRAASRLFGYSEEELVGVHIRTLFARNQEWDRFQRHGFRGVVSGKPLENFETVLSTKKGIPIISNLFISPLYSAGREPTGVVILVNDIRERKRLLARLKETTKELNTVKSQLERKLGSLSNR